MWPSLAGFKFLAARDSNCPMCAALMPSLGRTSNFFYKTGGYPILLQETCGKFFHVDLRSGFLFILWSVTWKTTGNQKKIPAFASPFMIWIHALALGMGMWRSRRCGLNFLCANIPSFREKFTLGGARPLNLKMYITTSLETSFTP